MQSTTFFLAGIKKGREQQHYHTKRGIFNPSKNIDISKIHIILYMTSNPHQNRGGKKERRLNKCDFAYSLLTFIDDMYI